MKLLLQSLTAFLVVFLASCGDGKADAAKQMAAVADSIKAASTVDLAEHHLPLVLHLPTGMPAPTVRWVDEVGKLEVRDGERFAMAIVEDPGDMGRLKADLDRDLTRQNTIVQENPDLLVYRSTFPDDTTRVFFHFHRLVQAAGRTFTVEDIKDGTAFTQAEVERMAASVAAKEPA